MTIRNLFFFSLSPSETRGALLKFLRTDRHKSFLDLLQVSSQQYRRCGKKRTPRWGQCGNCAPDSLFYVKQVSTSLVDTIMLQESVRALPKVEDLICARLLILQ